MTEGQPGYRLDHVPAAKQQIRSIAASAKAAGKLSQFTEILKQAIHRLQVDPYGWGDPERRVDAGDGVVCHGILRPVVFHYVVYERVRGVVLLRVQLFAEFGGSSAIAILAARRTTAPGGGQGRATCLASRASADWASRVRRAAGAPWPRRASACRASGLPACSRACTARTGRQISGEPGPSSLSSSPSMRRRASRDGPRVRAWPSAGRAGSPTWSNSLIACSRSANWG